MTRANRSTSAACPVSRGYFLGLPWQSRRGSSFIWGVWHDAKHVADHIATQRKYLDYKDAEQREAALHSTANTKAADTVDA